MLAWGRCGTPLFIKRRSAMAARVRQHLPHPLPQITANANKTR
jgi:hypothetical protein